MKKKLSKKVFLVNTMLSFSIIVVFSFGLLDLRWWHWLLLVVIYGVTAAWAMIDRLKELAEEGEDQATKEN